MRLANLRLPLFRTIAVAAVVALASSACGGAPAKPDRSGVTQVQAKWQKYAEIAARPAVKLDWRDRPNPPAGFTNSDMDAFAKREVVLIQRSSSAKVSRLAPDKAVDYVTAGLDYTTTRDYVSSIPPSAAGKKPWQWFLASLYKEDLLGPSKVIRVDWSTQTVADHLDNGTPARVLRLTLQVFVVHTFGPKANPRNVIVRRAVRLAGFRPTAGPAWWPALASQTLPYGNDGCALAEDSTLRPLHTAKYLQEDLTALGKDLGREGVIPIADKNVKPDPKAEKEATAFCAAHPGGL